MLYTLLYACTETKPTVLATAAPYNGVKERKTNQSCSLTLAFILLVGRTPSKSKATTFATYCEQSITALFLFLFRGIDSSPANNDTQHRNYLIFENYDDVAFFLLPILARVTRPRVTSSIPYISDGGEEKERLSNLLHSPQIEVSSERIHGKSHQTLPHKTTTVFRRRQNRRRGNIIFPPQLLLAGRRITEYCFFIKKIIKRSGEKMYSK